MFWVWFNWMLWAEPMQFEKDGIHLKMGETTTYFSMPPHNGMLQ